MTGAYSGVCVAAHTLPEDQGSATSELFRSGALQKMEFSLFEKFASN